MRCKESGWPVWLVLLGLTLQNSVTVAQQPNDADSAFPAAEMQSRGQYTGQAACSFTNSCGQTSRPADGPRQADPLNLGTTRDEAGQTSTGKSAEISSRDLDQLPPEAPTEFQRLVENSTGEFLQIYGSRLFRHAPSTFAPLDKVPVPADYVIGPGDELLIQVWGQVSLNSHVTVDRAGDIYIPQAGSVQVAGIPFAQLQSYLKTQMGRVFRNFDLNVNMGQLRSIQIFVVGQARQPGSYTVSSLSTLIDALFVTGGPTAQGSLRHVQLKRAGSVIVDFDLYNLLQHGDKSHNVPLLPGDVIYIPPVGAQVAVAGSVNGPAIYELGSGSSSTVGDALALASGATNVASNVQARIEHIDGKKMRSVTDLRLDQPGLSTLLHDGDILELAAIVDRFSNGVTLRGNVANPGRYDWKLGMKVGDLFPDKDALITRNYWLKRAQLGKPILTYKPFCPVEGDAQSLTTAQDAFGTPNCVEHADRTSGEDDSTLNHAGADRAGVANQPATDTGVGVRSPAIAAITSSPNEFQPRNDVLLSAPEIDWSYAVIERQDSSTLTTSLIPFNLGKLVLDGDTSQNIELKPSDVITIFSKADIRVPQMQQTRFVRLEGEFLSSGIYSVLPNETLPQLIVRAGGLSPGAYLYGSEFTRETTRRIQQQRLNEYIDQILLQTQINVASTSSSRITAVETAAQQGQSQNVINSLRQARASGRIVLGLRPEAQNVAELPMLSLENGDTFIVPHRPSTVSVNGAVYNPSTFVFDPGRKVRYYLNLAGGPTHNADRKRAYVIRADGSVISKQQMSSARRNGFDSLHVYPGDTVIVPLNLNKGATLRTVVDVAQIFGQFGIALAAANVIF